MPKGLRWLGYLAAGLAAIAIALYVTFRVMVGAVNFASGGGELDRAAFGAQVRVADGFGLSVFAEGVANARVLRFTDVGDLLVAQPNVGSITLLRDGDGDGRAESREVLLEGLAGPNGLDFLDDWLYVALEESIVRYPFDHAAGAVTGQPETVVSGLPGGGNHWKKTLRFGPDGMLYLTVGSSCNVCLEEDPRRAAMVRYAPDGSGETIFAEGLRNSAGFDWGPDGHIYATDNGRDLLGDDFPPCELNQVTEGAHYGWPFANGDGLADPDFGEGHEALVASSVSPVYNYPAHNAPLGIEFLEHPSLPASYRGSAIVALHGSWNRAEKDGYKVVSMHWDDAGKVSSRDFVWGFLAGDAVIGRPAEIEEGPDGAVYVSDDYANAVYRIVAGESGVAALPAPASVVMDGAASLQAYGEERLARLDERGQKAFRRYACAGCHAGKPDQVALVNLATKYDVAGLSAYLERPTPSMPAYTYDDETLEALAVHLLVRDTAQ